MVSNVRRFTGAGDDIAFLHDLSFLLDWPATIFRRGDTSVIRRRPARKRRVEAGGGTRRATEDRTLFGLRAQVGPVPGTVIRRETAGSSTPRLCDFIIIESV